MGYVFLTILKLYNFTVIDKIIFRTGSKKEPKYSRFCQFKPKIFHKKSVFVHFDSVLRRFFANPSIVGIFKGTQADDIIKIIKEKFTEEQRRMVKEVTLDMANSMNLIATKCFPKHTTVIDRFHVQKMACDAVQQKRINYRWEAIDQDNQAYKQAKEKGEKYKPDTFENGDTLKQLLARSRYLLFKPSHKWTESQKQRANILFNVYPEIEQAYDLSHHLYLIYSRNITKPVAMTYLAQWFNQIELTDIDTFQVLKRTFKNHYNNIINYFNNRSTNAAAESFNAKIKEFRRQFRGVSDVKFFLFRLTKIFA